ncbi:MAG: 23S rRNA (adenine(2503)-C(2))-methyltransferase RlmN [Candidatus Zapsychrus exili]|nr:23S rRNA (adenine(2503)-C(2))-methyltransferase RlmN [Candidatus Zapsychrus exili]
MTKYINSTDKQDILNLSLDELVQRLFALGEKSYRAGQIFEWIYQRSVDDFEKMTNLSAVFRDKLKENFKFPVTDSIKKEISTDKITKILFELEDKQKIETVIIPTSKRVTVCISTQAGCKYACKFCASGINGFKRDLSSAEILSQIIYVKSILGERELTHIVFMGVGEPLDNYDNVIKAIKIINSKDALNIAARRITISTCGLIPQIKKLISLGLQIELSVSLHGSNDKIRTQLMPVNKIYPLKDLIVALKEYSKETNRQITFEYILIKDLTATNECVDELGRLLREGLFKVNFISYNKVEEFGYEPVDKGQAILFKDRLTKLGVHCTLRAPRGSDISAACGQLRTKY